MLLKNWKILGKLQKWARLLKNKFSPDEVLKYVTTLKIWLESRKLFLFSLIEVDRQITMVFCNRTFFSQILPPYNGFGSLEDSLQSCLSLVPQPPKKDFIKMLENDNKVLRYEAILVIYYFHSKHSCFLFILHISSHFAKIKPVKNFTHTW